MNYTVIVAEDEELLLNNLVHKIEKADPDFIRLAEAFTQPDNDKNLIDIIKKLLQYIFCNSYY